ncbi:hypothetical protein A3H85_00100 [Candidatus Daviesbacteria bacterium RIFCSPLOWO2_02_FULL_40_8]|uniref:Uncharacterized protein n=1 Tax=Candidatus Daviesbacteria bacterium RIFCSPLOWO2_01_FULL_40_24 TaxID=1797787 RepID=A0A1F5MKG4_9BACT|nr:MAG: hypothetical protein A2780_02300 [Candidatus Daviesbacteria bacterium RIFCSPHIGHO2_01_FULL_41_45]OGE34605.1 MAG: hypothetical protein A3C32_02610 [Candidatus Daviesbacteria bacterium RIFCSPHIGHO2_02_FULL_41_14]OGE65843.1 MAG: hypothetical protein A3B49_03220 [Candidatus Daviesbacteria bacterium RIFCSPLOWO2_01_FULL_40_24]OGE66843.1 MAG: hypothetical protein A3H85_00100 [Candidatus Daviesbacteria bacterium RIFCSPLOWO2_02_FULL_40_8]
MKICAKCGSNLIELTKVQSVSGNSTFPLTTTTYKCTNEECQKSMDQEKLDREAQRLERANRSKPLPKKTS